MKKFKKPTTRTKMAQLPDDQIDYSDIPELDEDFWENAQVVMPVSKERITLRVDKDVLDYFRSDGEGYQTRINAVLRAYVEICKAKQPPNQE